MTPGLSAFVTARLDEKEQFARIARLPAKHRAHLLREVAAMRAILELARHANELDMAVEKEYATAPRDLAADPWHGDLIVRTLAAIWSDRPDYRPEWAA